MNVKVSVGDHPDGPGPVLTPASVPATEFETKQIAGTEVKLRRTGNKNMPAAMFTTKDGLLVTIFGPELPEGDAEIAAASVLQAYAET